jgi:hypothetical protein
LSVGWLGLHALYVCPAHEQNVCGSAQGVSPMHVPRAPQLSGANTHSCPLAQSAPLAHEPGGGMHAINVHDAWPLAPHEQVLQPSPAGHVWPRGHVPPLGNVHAPAPPSLDALASRLPPSPCAETDAPHASRRAQSAATGASFHR